MNSVVVSEILLGIVFFHISQKHIHKNVLETTTEFMSSRGANSFIYLNATFNEALTCKYFILCSLVYSIILSIG